jgi:hypothetical protein
MMKKGKEPPEPIARGPGPNWLRNVLAALALVYFFALLKHPPHSRGLRAISFFTESTCLFPQADVVAQEFRLDGWSCACKAWAPIDPRAYFPIQADDKESRFQRFAYFYKATREAMQALEAWVLDRHDATDDGLAGAIGGIRLTKWTRPIPDPGTDLERYEYRPLTKVPDSERKDLYYTPASKRKARCTP